MAYWRLRRHTLDDLVNARLFSMLSMLAGTLIQEEAGNKVTAGLLHTSLRRDNECWEEGSRRTSEPNWLQQAPKSWTLFQQDNN
jgi:hypothetical protein